MIRKCQTACKPGSVRPAGAGAMAIHLGRPLPDASRDLPGRRRGNAPRRRPACRPYSVLLPVGFTVPPPSPGARCALTAPFHPCPPRPEGLRPGGLLSVALSLGSPPPGVTRHRVSVEPGLSSPGRPKPAEGDHPAVWQLRCRKRGPRPSIDRNGRREAGDQITIDLASHPSSDA